jgi:hypothetical protein
VSMLDRVISGGQTGADQAALRAARACGISTGGWAPRGWLTEAGPAPWLAEWGLAECPEGETEAERYLARRRRCVKDSFAVVCFGDMTSPGSRALDRDCCGMGKQLVFVKPGLTPRGRSPGSSENTGSRHSWSPGNGKAGNPASGRGSSGSWS